MNIRTDKFVCRSDLEATIRAIFPSRKMSYTAISSFLTEIVNLNHREIPNLYKNQNYVANKCETSESNYDV